MAMSTDNELTDITVIFTDHKRRGMRAVGGGAPRASTRFGQEAAEGH